MATIKDVAKLAGVSVATVSRVLNSPEVVAAERRLQVFDAIKELNYVQNEVARGLITKQSKSIGVMVPDIANLYFSTLIKGLADGFCNDGYDIFLCIIGSDFRKEEMYLNNMRRKQVGLVMSIGTRPLEPGRNDAIIAFSKELPVFMVNEYIPGCDVYSLRTDEVSGAYMAVKYLLDLGHRKIGFINGNRNYYTNYYKKVGYEMALTEYGISVNSAYCVQVDPYEVGGMEGTEVLLALEDPPTALFVASDQIAVGTYRALNMHGLKIPQDMSVMGFSAMPFSAMMFPALTTIDQYPYAIGLRAATMAINILNGSLTGDKQVVLQPKVLERDSCAPVRTEKCTAGS